MFLSVTIFCLAIFPLTNGYERIFGFKKYTEYQPGSLNVILSSPHGGYLKPDTIPDRVNGCWVEGVCVWTHDCTPRNSSECQATLEHDTNTQELTILLADKLQELTGKRPHVIINKLSRTKLDANREMYQATLGVPDAMRAWIDFSSFILRSKSTSTGPGLYIDMHGQSHPEKWVELGYHIAPWMLNFNIFNPSCSSIAALARRTTESFNKILRGTNSFGGLLQQRGYKTIPSPDHPAPYGGNYFWAGGRGREYNTKTYGSKNGGMIDGIQLESPRYVRNLDNVTHKYVTAVAEVIKQFIN